MNIYKKIKIRINELLCNHEHWNCDNQIRVIECKKCHKRSLIDDYVDLYSPFKNK